MIQNKPQKPWRERLNLSRWAINHSRLTIGFWIVVTVVGLLAGSQLKYGLFPDVTFPVVVVNATADLSEVLETESQLTIPIEAAIQPLENVEDIRSSTYPGRTIMSSKFLVGTSLEWATETVEKTLNQLNLPSTSSFTIIPLNLNESTAISYAMVSQGKSLQELSQIAQQNIIPQLMELPGVLKVNLLGDETASTGDLSSVSSSQSLIQETPTLVRLNQENAIAVQVVKQADANTLEVVHRVEETVQNLKNEYPEIQLILAETQADYIRESTQSTLEALGLGILLAIAILFPFLRNGWATLISAIAIPLSLLGTCIVMAISGFNLETITLLALTLVIGIVVDDAIVEVENISRHLEAGKSPKNAAISATNEIGLTVSASTLTIVAVFLPIGFMGNALGQFFKPFALTISVAVLISLLVARTLSPVLAVHWLKSNSNLLKISQKKDSFILKLYQKLLRFSLGHRSIIVLMAIMSLISGILLIPLIPQGFLPQLDRGEFNVIYTTDLPKLPKNFQLQPSDNLSLSNPSQESTASIFKPEGFNWLKDFTENPIKLVLKNTRISSQEIEETLLETDAVESIYNIIGFRGQPNTGKIYVRLKENRQLTTAEVQNQVRQALPPFKTIQVSVEDLQFVETGDQQPVQIVLVGENLEPLRQTAQRIKSQVEQQTELTDITVNGVDNNAIEHFQTQRAVYITSNLSQDGELGDATTKLVNLAQPFLTEEITLKLTGDSARMREVFQSFAITLAISVSLMLTLLILPFGRILEPLVVGLSLPLSIVGAMLALLITQSAFGIISLIGLIFLLGLLDKNALLIMDYINQLRHRGLSRTEAILAMGKVRLRPIFMTTTSTILGMLPIAFGFGAGAELRQPMAVAIIGGLITSTLLSLIVVPVVYTLLEDGWMQLKYRLKMGKYLQNK